MNKIFIKMPRNIWELSSKIIIYFFLGHKEILNYAIDNIDFLSDTIISFCWGV